MTVHATYPLYYTPNTINSGIVNINGPLIHGSSDTFEAPLLTGVERGINALAVLPIVSELITSRPAWAVVMPVAAVPAVHTGLYVQETIDTTVTGIGNTLGFYYFVAAEPPPEEEVILKQIFSDGLYTYGASNAGLHIYRYDDGTQLTIRNLEVKAKTVWGDSQTLFIGTEQGVYHVLFVDLYADIYYCDINKMDLFGDKDINHIHGAEYKLFVSTATGMEYMNIEKNPPIHSKCTISGVNKGFITNSSSYYMTDESLNRIDTMLCDWSEPTYSYTTGSGILEAGIKLTDMFITEETAENGGNTIFCTTSSGVYVIDEDSQKYAIYYTR